MSDAYIGDRTVTTRKPHRCYGCCETIPTGVKARYMSGVEFGGFWHCYLCPACYEWIMQHPERFQTWEEFHEGEIKEDMEEAARDAGRQQETNR